ncbi:GMC family oxidoreductase [Umezawaea sp. NPDC059074]|uniref:GMC family oxidoreductase n=1 Tax=Umezawaea sp. NPDC059074 TaxID=3346716 RepID=UPI00367FCD95
MRHGAHHDYVIIGSGIAGCVMANRLSQDPDTSVLLLEAGPDVGADPRVATPARWPELLLSEYDWAYRTVPQTHLNGRRINWPRGRAVGGSTALHAMVYIRGHATDFDAWARFGGDDWTYDRLLPWFERAEDETAVHGSLSVREQDTPHPLAEAFVEAGEQLGFPRNRDFNGTRQHGVGFYRVMQRHGLRCSAADAYLAPAAHRPNLTILPGTKVSTILLESGRATGVRVWHSGTTLDIHAAREVVLCAGTIESPHLLMLSGIGPADHLRRVGVFPRVDLPGVGANLHDHVQVSVSLACRDTFPIAASSNLGEAGGFLSTAGDDSPPDVQLSFAPMRNLNAGTDFGNGLTIGPAVTRPVSRGRLTLTSADPWTAPAIDPGYLTRPEDLRTLVDGVTVALALARTPALSAHIDGDGGWDDRTDLEEFCRNNAETQFHPVGTCRLGTDDNAVVDPSLRVRGVDGLRVVDASVIPAVTTGNISAPVFALAEKIAAQITGSTRTTAAIA